MNESRFKDVPNTHSDIVGDGVNPFSICLEHKKRRVILTYNDSVVGRNYAYHIKLITEAIELCIKKSFHISETERP